MKLYVTHSSQMDYGKQLYEPLKQSLLWAQHEIILPHDTSKEPLNSKPILKTCDRVLAEVSYPSTGQGIELAWSQLFGIPVICFYKEGGSHPASIKFITRIIFAYKDTSDLLHHLENLLPTSD